MRFVALKCDNKYTSYQNKKLYYIDENVTIMAVNKSTIDLSNSIRHL